MLRDKVAVVYGAGGGIGGAVAQAFAREGARLFLTGRDLASVEIVAKDSPIMRGVPEKWVTIPEELYELERVWPGMTPLAQAFSVESKKTYPLIWTNTHGKARVFVTSLGHNTAMIEDPVYLGLVTRGFLWTVDKLQNDGTPAPGTTPRKSSWMPLPPCL